MVRKRAFAEKLQECRKRAGYSSPTQFADTIGVNRSVISKAENPEKYPPPTYPTFMRIKNGLKSSSSDVELEYLESLWIAARNLDENNGDPFRHPIYEKMKEITRLWGSSSPELEAVIDDVKNVLNNWQAYYLADSDLKDGQPSYSKLTLEELIPLLGGQALLRMLSYNLLAKCRRYLAEPSEDTFRDLDAALDIAENTFRGNEPEIHSEILLTKGDLYRRLGQLDKAFSQYESSQQKYTKVTDVIRRTKGLARCEQKIAGTLLYKGRAVEAEEYCRSCIKKYKSLQSEEGIIKGEQHLAWAKAMQGYYQVSIDIHKKHLEVLNMKANDAPLELAKAQSYYAEILRVCRNFAEAERFFIASQKSLSNYAEKLLYEKDILIRGPIFVGLGQTLIELRRLDEAETVLNRSEIANEQAPYFFARTMSAIGKLAIARGNWEEAFRRFQKAEDMFENLQNDYYSTAMLLNKAELYFRKGDYKESRSWAKEALIRDSDNINLKIHQIKGMMWLALAGITESGSVPDAIASLRSSLHHIIHDLANEYLINEVFDRLENQVLQIKRNGNEAQIKEIATHTPSLTDIANSEHRGLNNLLLPRIEKLEGMLNL